MKPKQKRGTGGGEKPEVATGLAAEFVRWRHDPRLMARELFNVTPDEWQDDALIAFPTHPRVAMKACAGPGKTMVLALLGWNFLLTRPFPMIGATSITGDNLRSNLWTELARWYERAPLLQRMFEFTGSAIFSRQHPKTWRLEARTWPKDANKDQIGNSLAGIHANYVMWLLDETGAYPEAVLPICEGIFAGNPVEAHLVQAGNPTNLSGPLYRACGIARHLWHVIEITGDPDDPKRSPRIPLDYAREQIQQYGRDNPWVMARLLGKFPPSSINALIGPDDVYAAMHRYYRVHEIGQAPRIMGVDVAREGDDASVRCRRQGIQVFPFAVKRNIDSTQGAGWIAREWDDWQADACFVDDTGGFGAGWIDRLRDLQHKPIGVGFARAVHDDKRYANKRAEMYFDAVAWIKAGGALPECPELTTALTQITYTFRGDRILLEDKRQLKARIGFSPDHADSFVVTFAERVEPTSRGLTVPREARVLPAYTPPGFNIEDEVRASYDLPRGYGRY